MVHIHTKETAEKLVHNNNIWMATVRSDGRPHLVPVWFVWIDEKIYLCIEPGSVKARNIHENPAVTLALEDGSHPVICEGKAEVISLPWPETVTETFQHKYDWNISTESRYTLLVEVVPLKWLSW